MVLATPPVISRSRGVPKPPRKEGTAASQAPSTSAPEKYGFKERAFAILMVLLCGFMCKQCAGEYAKGGDKQAMANYEKMIADNTRAEATLAPEVTKVTVKIMRIPVEFYECGYSFRVGDGEYEGKALLDKLPEGGRIWISYLRDDPSVNCQDPAKSLESEKAKDSSIGGLLWATGWGLFGLIMLAGVFAKAD